VHEPNAAQPGELSADPDHLVIGMRDDDQERAAEPFLFSLEPAQPLTRRLLPAVGVAFRPQ
jgi:hypothetical protein